MTNRKFFGLLFLSLILISFFSASVSALGVAPARRVLQFEPGKLVSYDINILNSEAEDQILAVYTTGAMADYVSLDRSIIRMDKEDSGASVKVNIKMPEDFDPGTAKTNILITKLPEDAGIKDDLESEVFSGNLDSNIGASIVIAHQLWVEVPYPGKYVKAKLRVQKFDGKPEFVVSLYSVGDEFINNIDARIEILGATFEELAELRTNSISLSSGNEGRISAVWDDADVNAGVYRVRAIVEFDGQTLVLEDNFYFGEIDVEIKGLTVNNFRLGTVAKFNALIESGWNSNLEGVYGEFDVLQKGQVVSNFLTAPIDLGAYREENLVGYWDTEGFDVGEYDILVKVHYGGKVSEKLFDAVVSLDDIKISNGASGKVVGNSDGEGSRINLLIILMLGLLIVNGGLFFYIWRYKK